jgi:transcriptional regulator with XRE-family HTH domain
MKNKEENKMKYGVKIKELRLAKNIGLREFCEKANLDPSNWSKIERGFIYPSTKTFDKIMEVLNIKKFSLEYYKIYVLLLLDKTKIIPRIDKESYLLKALPIILCLDNGEKPTERQLDRLEELLCRFVEDINTENENKRILQKTKEDNNGN